MLDKSSTADVNEEWRNRPSLPALFMGFLKIGATAFGGFMALIAVVENYVVEREKLLTHEDMLDGVSLATILPGPVAVNVVAYAGYRVRGGAGALVSAAGVLLPSFVLVLCLSYFYFQFGGIPSVGKFFLGFIPAVAAIIFVAAWNMASKAIKGRAEAIIAAGAAALLMTLPGFSITMGIVAAGALAGRFLFKAGPEQRPPQGAGPVKQAGKADVAKTKTGSKAAAIVAAPIASFFSCTGFNAPILLKLLTTFGGMSLLLFGGGYVFIPVIRVVVVEGNGWVSAQEFIDGIALGQVTPGPILISAAFLGYKVAGISGAAVATIGIFTPPAVLMIFCTRFLDRIKRSGSIKAALRGVRPAVIGLIAAAGVSVIRTAPMDVVSFLIFGAALAGLLKFKLETAWIIPLAGVAGLIFY